MLITLRYWRNISQTLGLLDPRAKSALLCIVPSQISSSNKSGETGHTTGHRSASKKTLQVSAINSKVHFLLWDAPLRFPKSNTLLTGQYKTPLKSGKFWIRFCPLSLLLPPFFPPHTGYLDNLKQLKAKSNKIKLVFRTLSKGGHRCSWLQLVLHITISGTVCYLIDQLFVLCVGICC